MIVRTRTMETLERTDLERATKTPESGDKFNVNTEIAMLAEELLDLAADLVATIRNQEQREGTLTIVGSRKDSSGR